MKAITYTFFLNLFFALSFISGCGRNSVSILMPAHPGHSSSQNNSSYPSGNIYEHSEADFVFYVAQREPRELLLVGFATTEMNTNIFISTYNLDESQVAWFSPLLIKDIRNEGRGAIVEGNVVDTYGPYLQRPFDNVVISGLVNNFVPKHLCVNRETVLLFDCTAQDIRDGKLFFDEGSCLDQFGEPTRFGDGQVAASTIYYAIVNFRQFCDNFLDAETD